MARLTLNILWTKVGDETPHRRLRELTVEVPVASNSLSTRTIMTDAELDALLTLPMLKGPDGYKDTTYTVRMPGLHNALDEKCVLNHAIPEALRQIEDIRCMQAERAEKAKRIDTQRAKEIGEWVAKHGSTRLQEQLKQGMDGWPLYLHERMAKDFPGFELDNDGKHGLPVVNPTESLLKMARRVAERIVENGVVLSTQEAFGLIEIVPIKRESDDDPQDVWTRVYVTFSGYRPGSEAFETKTIRICCEIGD